MPLRLRSLCSWLCGRGAAPPKPEPPDREYRVIPENEWTYLVGPDQFFACSDQVFAERVLKALRLLDEAERAPEVPAPRDAEPTDPEPEPPGTLAPNRLTTCQYCGQRMAPFLATDYDGLNFYCSICGGFLGATDFVGSARRDSGEHDG